MNRHVCTHLKYHLLAVDNVIILTEILSLRIGQLYDVLLVKYQLFYLNSDKAYLVSLAVWLFICPIETLSLNSIKSYIEESFH